MKWLASGLVLALFAAGGFWYYQRPLPLTGQRQFPEPQLALHGPPDQNGHFLQRQELIGETQIDPRLEICAETPEEAEKIRLQLAAGAAEQPPKAIASNGKYFDLLVRQRDRSHADHFYVWSCGFFRPRPPGEPKFTTHGGELSELLGTLSVDSSDRGKQLEDFVALNEITRQRNLHAYGWSLEETEGQLHVRFKAEESGSADWNMPYDIAYLDVHYLLLPNGELRMTRRQYASGKGRMGPAIAE